MKIRFFFFLFIFFAFPFSVFATYSSDVTGSGTCSSDSYYDGNYVCSKAFDNSTLTAWSSSTGPFPHWIKYDFGNGVTFTITKLVLYTTIDASNHSKSFTLSGSNNDTDYTTVYTGQIADEESTQTFTFSNSTAYRYYKVNVTDNWSGGTATNFKEVELMYTIAEQSTSSTSTAINVDSTPNIYFFGFLTFVVGFLLMRKFAG